MRQHPSELVKSLDVNDPLYATWAEAAEWAEELDVQDVWQTGGIDLCRSFATRRAYKELLLLREKHRQPDWVARRRTVSHGLGVLGYALVHEFGHLVDAELSARPAAEMEHVYGALSRALLDLPSVPRASQWSLHLVNFPKERRSSRALKAVPPRERMVRESVGGQVELVLGKYAATCRDELFAESFVAMWAGKDAVLRQRMVVFLRALQDVGLAVRRRPPRLKKL